MIKYTGAEKFLKMMLVEYKDQVAKEKEIRFYSKAELESKSIKELLTIKNKLSKNILVKKKYIDYKYCVIVTIEELQFAKLKNIIRLQEKILTFHQSLLELKEMDNESV